MPPYPPELSLSVGRAPIVWDFDFCVTFTGTSRGSQWCRYRSTGERRLAWLGIREIMCRPLDHIDI